MIVEVRESSLRYDLEVKSSLYARYGVPEYWVIDLDGRQVRFFRAPQDGRYTDVTSTPKPGIVTPVTLPSVQIDLTHILDD